MTMNFLVRFLCYDGPDRQQVTQIGIDQEWAILPQYQYGQPVVVEPSVAQLEEEPPYFVAHIPHARPNYRTSEKQYAALVTIYLARVEQWPAFAPPELILEPVH